MQEMNFVFVDGVLHINVDMVTTVAVAGLLLVLGYYVKSKVYFLTKYCIPAPVVGGFLFMFFTWFGMSQNLFSFNFVTTLQPIFMLAFFTTVGMGASISLLRKGGTLLAIYWAIACVLSVFQNILAMALGPMLGLDHANTLMLGAMTMIGGHGAAAAYGATFADMGFPTASVVGASAATFGLVASVVFGGPISRRLIEKHNLKPDPTENFDTSAMDDGDAADHKLTGLDVIKNVTAIFVCMALGTMISNWIGGLIDMTFPAIVGALFISMFIRNLNEKVRVYRFDYKLTESIGDVTLALFLSMALMTLRIWELVGLFAPMFVILFAQLALVVVTGYFIVFRMLGKNYDAAVMVAGYIGHGVGATPTAIVNMTAVNDRYGPSRKAMIIVPIVGAFLVDFIYHPQTIWFIRMFVQPLN